MTQESEEQKSAAPFQESMRSEGLVDEGEQGCTACGGYGDIWTNWHPTPVQCGVCRGTGKAPTETTTSDRRADA